MRSTRRNNKRNKSSVMEKMAEDPNARTFHGLNHWYVYVFKHYGWMILEKERGVFTKVEAYKDSVNRLIKSLEFKFKELHEKDRKEDILIMLNNVKILKKCMDNHL